MGKITEALDKIQKQRELQKQAWSNKKKAQAPTEEVKQEVLEKQSVEIEQLQKASLPKAKASRPESSTPKQQVAGKLMLEQRLMNLKEALKGLKEKLKNNVYIVKATDESGIDPRVVTYFNHSTPVSEQYRILRTNILSKSLDKSAKVFLISSAFHGEGKTVTAVNLAVALAQDLTKKVCLVDCDLRGGNIHQLLNTELSPGLSDIMANGTASEAVFQNSKIENLSVVTRGEIPSNPSELLGSKRMKRLLEELKSSFDYIILDAPPSISITDASILGAQTDGVVLVVQAQRTQAPSVRQAQELLRQARAKVIGFVLTHVDHYSPRYYSYYYHYRKKEENS